MSKPRLVKSVTSYDVQYETEFPWVAAAPNDKLSAKCKLCNRTFSISSMGKTALTSHAAGKKHQRAESAQRTTPSATEFSRHATQQRVGENPREDPDDAPIGFVQEDDAAQVSAPTAAQVPVPTAAQVSVTSSAPEVSTSGEPSSLIKKYMSNDSVTKAEILWCIHAATRIHSNRAAADCVSLFPVMFPDSVIAQKMQLQKDKVSYLTVFGLAPYFKKLLFDKLDICDYISIGFDEALNDISTKKQMDIAIRYWDFETNLVCTRYLTSVFMRSAKADDFRKALKESLVDKLESKLLHISMDGPAVNFKMLKDIQTALKEDEGPALLDVGSCGLHVVHGAFKTAAECVSWELKAFLMAIHFVFKDSPARRGHFIQTTGSEEFATPFCFTRWIENAKAGRRALSMLPHLRTWVEQVRSEGRNNPLNKRHKQFDKVEKGLKDRLLGPKIAFFVAMGDKIEPFLTTFQSNDPMAPLLFRELTTLTIGLLELVVKDTVLSERTNILSIDLKKESNLIPAAEFDLGLATKSAIREASRSGKIPDAEILKFRMDCHRFTIRMIEKIQERSPLSYKLTRAISCLDPLVVLETPSLAKERISLALEIMCLQKNRISGAKADRIKRHLLPCPQPQHL